MNTICSPANDIRPVLPMTGGTPMPESCPSHADPRVSLQPSASPDVLRLDVRAGTCPLLVAWRRGPYPERVGQLGEGRGAGPDRGRFVVVPAGQAWHLTAFSEAFTHMVTARLDIDPQTAFTRLSGGRGDHIIEVCLDILFDRSPMPERPDAIARDLLQSHLGLLAARGRLDHLVPRSGALAPWQVNRVLKYMAERVTEDISLAELAALVRLSPKHFARAFKVSVGEPPYRYVMRKKIEHAKALLFTELSLAETALACGFADQSHFTTAFRKIEGLPPGMWRRLRQLDSGEEHKELQLRRPVS